MSNKLTYRNIYSLVAEEIDKRLQFNTTTGYKNQSNRTSVSPLVGNAQSDIATAELITSIHNLLKNALPSRIIEGLTVESTYPISNNITISAGKGTIGGYLYELEGVATITIPFDDTSSVFYIVLFQDNILIDKTYNSNKLTIAKIIIPQPGLTCFVQNDKDNSSNAYIVNFAEYKLYGYNNKFEEDTIELLRENISPILADNLIGNIRLSEDLKITNTQGTLELNSNSLKLYDVDENLLSKFNQNGVYFYSSDGIERARFTNVDARVGNILINTNSLQSTTFASGSLGQGFKIWDSGNAEFNNVLMRGKLTASVFEKDTISVIGGNLLVMDGDILDEDMTASDTSTLTISGDTTFSLGDILRIKDGVEDEWLKISEFDNFTKLLIHFNGTDASTVDYTAETGQVVSLEGTAQLDTAQKKFGSASLLLDGNSDYVTIPDSDDWYFDTGDFTVDCWVRWNALPVAGSQKLITHYQDLSNRWQLQIAESSGVFTFRFLHYPNNATADIDFSKVSLGLVINTWYHIAVVRNGNSWYIFQDGVQIGTTETNTNSILNNTGLLYIGQRGDSSGFLDGWIDEFRISKGIARWTANFTVPISEYSYINETTYTVQRDKGENYTVDNNPSWKKGTAVVNFGQSGEGGVYLTSSESNSPYISMVVHSGSPWSTLTTKLRLGNLTGITDSVLGALSGYGLYADNVFLKGKLYAPDIKTAISGRRIELSEDGLFLYDVGDLKKFGVYIDSISGEGDVGDVIIGNVGADNYIMWDDSLGTLIVRGDIVAGSIFLGDRNYVTTVVFSNTDYNTVEWTSGNIEFSDGTTKTIVAGNTGNIANNTYIYFDDDVSQTVLQTTTTYSSSVGANKVLLAITDPGESGNTKPLITTGRGFGTIIDGTSINTPNLSAISANLGSITAGTVTGATLQTATSGSRIVMDTSKLIAYDDNGDTVFIIDLEGPSAALTDVGDVMFGGINSYLKWDKSLSSLILQSKSTSPVSSEKIIIKDNTIKIYDEAGNERVILGRIA